MNYVLLLLEVVERIYKLSFDAVITISLKTMIIYFVSMREMRTRRQRHKHYICQQELYLLELLQIFLRF